MRDAFQQLRAENHSEFREISIFPGVELSVGRVHCLALFDPSTEVSVVDGLIGAARFRGVRGESDASCEASITDICQETHRLGGILIPAHCDKPTGAFVELRGNALLPLLECESIVAMEIIEDVYATPQMFGQKKLRWSRVLGSDSHHPTASASATNARFPGSHYSWVKMGKPSIEGLRLALLDGEQLSLRRSTQCSQEFNPNQPPENRIESIEITEARYCGRGQPLRIELSPWMNTVIGGRGSGKSSILEFGRFALGREKDLPATIQAAVDRFGQVPKGRDDDGAMTATTKIALVYRKDSDRYRLTWITDGSAQTMEEETATEGWQATEGDIRQRFPVRVFSQRQIAALAEQSSALLALVDEAPEVGIEILTQSLSEKHQQYLSLRAQGRVLTGQLSEEAKLRGALEDIDKKLAVFKDAKHAEVLENYQRREKQCAHLATIEKEFADAVKLLSGAASNLIPTDLNQADFDSSLPADQEVVELLQEGKQALRSLSEGLSQLVESETSRHSAWNGKVKATAWNQECEKATRDFQTLKTQLEAIGARDVSEFGRLNGERLILAGKIDALQRVKTQRDELEAQASTALTQALEARRQLTAARTAFLSTVLGTNAFVRMTVKPYGWEPESRTIERSFRELLGCADDRESPRYADDILTFNDAGQPNGGLIAEIYSDLPPDTVDAVAVIEQRWAEKKTMIHEVRYAGAEHFGAWFRQFLQKLKAEDIDRLLTWMPNDGLEVKYSPRGLGTNFRPLRQASLGQKAAAILAFVLSYGNDPLILDQPEDDLDNELIYDLIVKQIRAGKAQRQLLVVTHNPNIVVNGDAELVVAMEDTGGRCIARTTGTLQEPKLREAICKIMEGGYEAFEQRYQRIGKRPVVIETEAIV